MIGLRQYGNVVFLQLPMIETGVERMNQPWYCTKCGTENHPNSVECFECRTPRAIQTYPPGTIPPAAGGYGPPPGYATPPGHAQIQQPRKINPVIPVSITCSILILVMLVVGLIAAVSLPNFVKVKEKAKEAEVKQNLHSIQLGVERFAVDHAGAYPAYLIGGAAEYASTVNGAEEAIADNVMDSLQGVFQGINECSSRASLSDPLLREGYLESYPINPFVRNGAAIHLIQGDLSSTPAGNDPLRNACNTGAEHGTRFGPLCNLMGSVLADLRYPRTTVPVDGGKLLVFPTGADTEYQYWDMWEGEKPYPYMPGMFFYKSMGPLTTSPASENSGQQTDAPPPPDTYILGVYGSAHTMGQDVLGPEEPIPGPNGESFWTYTRSEVSTNSQEVYGCPFMFKGTVEDMQVEFGNPNGIRDAILQVLTGGGGLHWRVKSIELQLKA